MDCDDSASDHACDDDVVQALIRVFAGPRCRGGSSLSHKMGEDRTAGELVMDDKPPLVAGDDEPTLDDRCEFSVLVSVLVGRQHPSFARTHAPRASSTKLIRPTGFRAD